MERDTQKPLAGVGIVVRHHQRVPDTWGGGEPAHDSVVTGEDGYAFIDESEYRATSLEVYSKDATYYDRRHGSGAGRIGVTGPFFWRTL